MKTARIMGFMLASLLLANAFGGEEQLEPSFLKKSEAITEGDDAAHLKLARWCREMGFIREMLVELDQIPGNAEASTVDVLAEAKSFELDFHRSAPERAKMLNRAKSKVFKMAKRSYRFNFHTDVDKERVQEHAVILNRFYDSLKNFFQIHKTELGIRVYLFGSRSDYLDYFQRYSKINVEHWSGFFVYSSDQPMLCFFDDRSDEEGVANTAKHECTHLLVKQCLKGAHMAHWLNEGLACFFAAHGEERVGSHAARCFMTVRHALRTRTVITLEDLMKTSYKEYHFRHYAFAWSWVCFLHSNPDYWRKMSRLFVRLRKKSGEPETVVWKTAHWEEHTHMLFHQLLDRPAALQQRWAAYVKEDLNPSTPEQLFYCASDSLALAGGLGRMEPPLKPEEQYEMLCEGERWLREARDQGDEDLAARCEVEIAYAILARAHSLKYSEREKTHAAAESRRILNRILSDSSRAGQFIETGYVIRRTLLALQRAGEYKNNEGTLTCDLVARMGERVDVLTKDRNEAGIKPDHDCDLTREIGLVEFQQQLAERLIREGRYAFGHVLQENPADRGAVLGWLFLALEYAPQDLDAVFPYLKFHVELDPDDEMLAALAAAYAAMGKVEHARGLLKRAQVLTPKKEMLRRFTRFIHKKE